MEQLNKVELIGTVGSVSIQNIGVKPMIRFSMATNLMYKNADGESVCETMWHNVVFFPGAESVNSSKLAKGSPVKVTGRLRNCRVTGVDGSDRTVTEVVAGSVQILEETRINPQNI